MCLFKRMNLTLSSGQSSCWKIECNALTQEDWRTLAMLAANLVGPFDGAIGIPTGGIRFALELSRYSSHGPVLLCDDVLTTGYNMELYKREIRKNGHGVKGVVAFARSKPPSWITPIFQLTQKEDAL